MVSTEEQVFSKIYTPLRKVSISLFLSVLFGKDLIYVSYLYFHFSCQQMQVLHVISFLIERMETSVRPYAGALVQYLPMLWDSSAEHNMLRCAILTTLVFLVQVRWDDFVHLCVTLLGSQ